MMDVNKTEIDEEDLLSNVDEDWENLLKETENIKQTKVNSASATDTLNWNKLLGSIYSKEKTITDMWERLALNITSNAKVENHKPTLEISTPETIEKPDYLTRNYEDFDLCSLSLDDNYSGYIVSSSGRFDSALFNYAPAIYLSNRYLDPTQLGVISSSKKEEKLEKNFKDSGIVINTSGQTSMWVCNGHSSINNGDLITTSIIPGVGIKQTDDVIKNYTVAKATMSCDFNPKKIPKKKFPPTLFDELGRPIYFYETELEPAYQIKYVTLKGDEITCEEYKNSEKDVFIIAKICVKLT